MGAAECTRSPHLRCTQVRQVHHDALVGPSARLPQPFEEEAGSLEHPRVLGTGAAVGDEPSELGVHLDLPLVGEAIGRHVSLGIDALLPVFRIRGSDSG